MHDNLARRNTLRNVGKIVEIFHVLIVRLFCAAFRPGEEVWPFGRRPPSRGGNDGACADGRGRAPLPMSVYRLISSALPPAADIQDKAGNVSS